MELDDALHRISEIHGQIVRGEMFRGYRALPIAITGGVAIGAAVAQSFILGVPSTADFALYWVTVAVACIGLCAWDLRGQLQHEDRTTLRRRSWPVIAQYLPALVGGGAVSLLLIDSEHAVLLPGLWAILHALGIFASRPWLPRAIGWVMVWYLGAGLLLLSSAADGALPSPSSMGVVFGAGQFLLALVLYLDLERVRPGERHGI